jgi:hypothetical protein
LRNAGALPSVTVARHGSSFLFIYSRVRHKSRRDCGNDETKLRTIQFSFFPNGVTLSLYSTEQMRVLRSSAKTGRRHDTGE